MPHWQGLLSHERLIKGFKVFVYIDHKNNLFTECTLDNRWMSTNILNWAVEINESDVTRVWIRGEANVLADAPSRAPWEHRLAKHLPFPTGPLNELIETIYIAPKKWDGAVQSAPKKLEPLGIV